MAQKELAVGHCIKKGTNVLLHMTSSNVDFLDSVAVALSSEFVINLVVEDLTAP